MGYLLPRLGVMCREILLIFLLKLKLQIKALDREGHQAVSFRKSVAFSIWCSSLSQTENRRFTQILELLAARLDAKLQMTSHADHDLAAYFGREGYMNLLDVVFQLTGIAIKLHEHFITCCT